jgi:hypothetical protein
VNDGRPQPFEPLTAVGFARLSPSTPASSTSIPVTLHGAAGIHPTRSQPQPAGSRAVGSNTSLLAALMFLAKTAIGLTQDPRPGLTHWGDVLQIVWRIVAPVLLGLTALSIRGRVKR